MTGNSDTHEYPVSQKSVILFALLFLLHKASYSLSLVLISIAFFLFLAEDPGEVLLVFLGVVIVFIRHYVRQIIVRYSRGRQPLARVPLVAREKIFHGTPSNLTRM